MKTIIINGFNTHMMSKPTKDFFKLRKRLFVDEMGWEIPHDGIIEHDQYDHENATYTIILEKNQVIAGARILPTTQRKNGWSYMIKDACDGKIDQIPRNLMTDAPVQNHVYEITRFTVDPDLSLEKRNQALEYLSIATYDAVAAMGGNYVLALMNPFFLRWFRNIGFCVEKLGPIVKGLEASYCVIGGRVEDISIRRLVA